MSKKSIILATIISILTILGLVLSIYNDIRKGKESNKPPVNIEQTIMVRDIQDSADVVINKTININ